MKNEVKNKKSGAICLLSAFFAIMFSVFTIIGPSKNSAFAEGNSAVLFDGSVPGVAIPAQGTMIEGVSVNIIGMSDLQSVSGGVTLDGKTYSKVIKTGGKTTSSRYISFTVPETITKFFVKVIAAPNGSEASAFRLSTDESGSGTNAFFTTGTDNDSYTEGISEIFTVSEPTTYYLIFSASVKIAYIEVAADIENAVEQNHGLSTYSGTSPVGRNEKITVTVEKNNAVSVIQIILGILLVLLVAVGIVCMCGKKRGKGNCLFDDFDDYEY